MRSRWFQGLALGAALSLTSGCMFMQWTDRAFIGSPNDPPTHVDREWVGAVVMPLAITGDIITAPFQVIALMITGDFGIYHYPREQVRLLDANDVRVAGVDSNGHVTELRLTDEQRQTLAARLQTGSFDPVTAPRLALR